MWENWRSRSTNGVLLVDGNIGKQETAAKTVEAAILHFGSIDVLVTNAGMFYTKPFTDFTTEGFNDLVSTNLLGFLYITQRSYGSSVNSRRCLNVFGNISVSRLS